VTGILIIFICSRK